MTESEILDLAERFMGAIPVGDAETVRACYAPGASIWHNNDGIEQAVDQNIKVLNWIARKLPQRHYQVLEATLPDGTVWAMPACVVVRMKDGAITRLDEYLDSAHSTALSALGQ